MLMFFVWLFLGINSFIFMLMIIYMIKEWRSENKRHSEKN